MANSVVRLITSHGRKLIGALSACPGTMAVALSSAGVRKPNGITANAVMTQNSR